MKLMKVISIAALTMAAISGVANAAISPTQIWHMVDQKLENTSNGRKLCMTGVAFEQATMEVCGSKPDTQNMREPNFAMNGALMLEAYPDYAYAPLSGKIYIREYDPIASHWDHVNGQLKKVDADGILKCLDIEGGINVPGAKLHLATCTN
ncbi:TPA: hypothetical protein ACJIWU_000381 [Enterobacter chengduensis]|uniref:DUF2147 domain-containing protein n=1 Tax=Enterobacter chengduensis TaxID=2494701 RepID=A0AAW3HEU9_9ENTR|nr:hypothetical protein [Enterobacter chengduensis]KDF47783.1 hypothetical protein AE07_01974 [Enterobacter cloacae BWH 43]OTW36443.1 hypothetical protein CAP57_02945 [Enterobacter kobei]GJL39556.1 hypothetical protein TUM17577_07650 [Enterobacter asburiae]KJX34879.1 hypothetical protein SG71_15615 [Enterobacter chengduensis]MBN9877015.1 hypothetical protein [Enterobacter chengduensis]